MVKEICNIIRRGVFCVHKPGFLMPGHIYGLDQLYIVTVNPRHECCAMHSQHALGCCCYGIWGMPLRKFLEIRCSEIEFGAFKQLYDMYVYIPYTHLFVMFNFFCNYVASNCSGFFCLYLCCGKHPRAGFCL